MTKVYGYDTNIYETSIGNIKHINDEEYLSNILKDFKGNLVEYIEQLKQKAELADHYKHLYSEVKKQKDDCIKYIHKELDRFDCEGSMSISMRISYFEEELLRMLGEIDDSN